MKLVSGFQHAPGLHCGSTALRDMVHSIGLDYSEEMCFGLGGALGFFYYQNPFGVSPTRLFHGRMLTLERDFCQHLALDFEEDADNDAEHAWETAKAWIDHDVPVLLGVELSELPYWRARTPFPGHRVVLVGYDDARRIVSLADTHFPGLQEVSYDALRDARASKIPPISIPNYWLAIKPTLNPRALVSAIRAALRDNGLGMNLDRAPYLGIMGMEALAEDFVNWSDAPDWEICARAGYQLIEVRGTGGSLFRKMYARFLREAEALDERLRAANLADAMDEIAGEWSALANLLRDIAKEKQRGRFQDAGRAMRRLALREENFWGRVLNIVGGV